jgi:DNA polymerase V
LDTIYKPGYEYKKAGIVLGDIGSAGVVQNDLFATPEDPKAKALMETMDRLNARYGRGTLKLSLDTSANRWGMKADNKSPCYTTVWEDILTVR